jgi:hypothetical protein
MEGITMRSLRFRFETPRVELSREEIMADLLYPAAPPELNGRHGRRPSRLRRDRRQARR